MSDTDPVALVGAKRMRKQLKAAGADLADLREPFLAAARTVASAGRAAAPRRTGALANTIRGGASRTAATIRAGNNTRVLYANPIHWGWPRRDIEPQPFLSHAAQRTEPAWLPAFMAELDDVVERIAKDYT